MNCGSCCPAPLAPQLSTPRPKYGPLAPTRAKGQHLMTVKEMKEQRIKLITDAQKLVLGDTVTAEQRDQANQMVADVEKLEADINLAEKLEKYEAETRETSRPPRSNPA